jgi:hypothetical protein
MSSGWRVVVTIAIKGADEDDHHVLLSELPEIESYQRLITEAARALFMADHPQRQRVLRGFESTLQMGFATVRPGSALLPLEVREADQTIFRDIPVETYVDRAVLSTAHSFRRAAGGHRPAEPLPPTVLELMEDLGASLADDRWMEITPAGEPEQVAVVDRTTRAAIAKFVPDRYEDDVAVEGEVTRADVLSRRFRLRVPGGRGIEAPFTHDDERRVTEALRDHDERSVMVRGRALIEPDGTAVRFVTVTAIEFADEVRGRTWAESWASLVRFADSHPVSGLPSDLASNVDDYLYRDRKRA